MHFLIFLLIFTELTPPLSTADLRRIRRLLRAARRAGRRARTRRPGGSVRGERANLKGLVLGCIEAKFCRKICVGKLSPRSTQCTPLHRSQCSKFASKIAEPLRFFLFLLRDGLKMNSEKTKHQPVMLGREKDCARFFSTMRHSPENRKERTVRTMSTWCARHSRQTN